MGNPFAFHSYHGTWPRALTCSPTRLPGRRNVPGPGLLRDVGTVQRSLQIGSYGRLLQGFAKCWLSRLVRHGCCQGRLKHCLRNPSRLNIRLTWSQTPFLGELLISWLLLLVSLPFCAWVIHTIRETNYVVEGTVEVDTTSDVRNNSNAATEAVVMTEIPHMGGEKTLSLA